MIFDRDGVLNVDQGYVGEIDRFVWIAGAMAAIRRLNRKGVLVIVATNQSGVARGLFDLAAVDAVHERMRADLAIIGAKIDAFYVCPYHSQAIVDAFRHPDHPDRKPNPGMILKALGDWRIEPADALVVGDQESDLEAARRAGVAAVLFAGGDLDAFLRKAAPGF
ncbi:MAG: D-glycero-alpha-D-manno-heptose-1,7-bisphosphate 7-phosphatase [Caulobacteraceae bacterium]